MINVTKLLEIIGRNPGIRTVQIADRLDCDIEVLRDVLHSHIESGEVVAFDVIAPNQRKAMAYRLKDVIAAPDSSPINQPAAEGTKTMTNIEKAMAFIAEQPGEVATSSQLHTLLGLKDADYASTYLGGGIKDGRLFKDGKNWTLGSGAPVKPEPVPVLPKVSEPEPITAVRTTPEVAQAPAPDPAAEIVAAPKAPAISHLDIPVFLQKQPGFRCALWSDGRFVIEDADQKVELSEEKVRQMLKYLDRMADSVPA